MGKLPKYLRWCFLNFSTTRMLSPLPCGNHLKRALSKSHLKPCNGTPLSTQKFLFLPVRHIRPSSASLCPFRFHLTNSSSHFVLGAVQMHWSLRALVLTKMILHSGKIVYLLLCNSSVSSSDSAEASHQPRRPVLCGEQVRMVIVEHSMMCWHYLFIDLSSCLSLW